MPDFENLSHFSVLAWTIGIVVPVNVGVSVFFFRLIWKLFSRTAADEEERRKDIAIALALAKAELAKGMEIVKSDLLRDLADFRLEIRSITGDHVRHQDFDNLNKLVMQILNKQGENTGAVAALRDQFDRLRKAGS